MLIDIQEMKENIHEKLTLENKVSTVNGVVSPDFSGGYFAEKGDEITLSMTLKGGEDVSLTSPPYPPFLMLPLIKRGGADVIIDEIYFKTTVENGVIFVQGVFPSAGNWQLIKERVNLALAEISVDWRVVSPVISFRIS